MSLLMSFTRPNLAMTTAPFATGVFIDCASWMPHTLTTGAISADVIYAMKLKIPRGLPISRLFCETTVAAAAGKLIRHALYPLGADGLPGALLYDTGDIAADAAAGDIGANVSMVLPYDEIWVATLSNGTPTLRAYLIERAPQFMGWATVAATTRASNLTKAQAYGAMPNPFGAGVAAAVPFRVGVKVA